MTQNRTKQQQGFTLVELLIVVIILGILAAVVIPQFNSAAAESREAAAASNLATIRQAIEMYKVQHNDTLPGQGESNSTNFLAQLTTATNADGSTSGGTQPYGPYLRNSFPTSPVDNSAAVTVTAGAISAPATSAVGWAYNSVTGEFRLNTDDTAASGVTYFSL